MYNLININGKTFTVEELNTFIEEAKKQTPKYPNGAEILPLTEGTKYYSHNLLFQPLNTPFVWKGDHHDFTYLQCQKVFLTQESLEKALAMEKKHFEIVQKVHEINAKNNWIADFKNNKQLKYFLYYSHSERHFKVKALSTTSQTVEYCMCLQAKNWLLEQTTEDLKAFLKMYN